MTNPILSVQDLATSFRVDGQWRDVVRGVNFDIGERETVAVDTPARFATSRMPLRPPAIYRSSPIPVAVSDPCP